MKQLKFICFKCEFIGTASEFQSVKIDGEEIKICPECKSDLIDEVSKDWMKHYLLHLQNGL